MSNQISEVGVFQNTCPEVLSSVECAPRELWWGMGGNQSAKGSWVFRTPKHIVLFLWQELLGDEQNHFFILDAQLDLLSQVPCNQALPWDIVGHMICVSTTPNSTTAA